MYSFCPHCGETLGQDQSEGAMLVCRHCRKSIGMIVPAARQVVVDKSQRPIEEGEAARCPACGQLVALREGAGGKAFVPHRRASHTAMCVNSGKPALIAPAIDQPLRPAMSKNLSAYMTREQVKVVSYRRGSEPQIELLTLEYLDKNDRVRLQIDAVRDILGPQFAIKSYPVVPNRFDLILWANATMCVIAKRHPHGGFLPMTDEEVTQVIEEVRRNGKIFDAVVLPSRARSEAE